ncbi:MAG: hypothetical protein IPJ98_24600 [Bryobacterales bacterium]|nr:hypothetical protein [Bryobacterales bacterium]
MRLTRVLNTIALATAVIAGLAAQTAQAQTYTILVNQQSTSAEIPEAARSPSPPPTSARPATPSSPSPTAPAWSSRSTRSPSPAPLTSRW